MEMFCTVHSCPAHFSEECLSHPLLLFSGQKAALEQQVIHRSAYIRTHGSDSAAALRAKCFCVCARRQIWMNSQHRFQVWASSYRQQHTSYTACQSDPYWLWVWLTSSWHRLKYWQIKDWNVLSTRFLINDLSNLVKNLFCFLLSLHNKSCPCFAWILEYF